MSNQNAIKCPQCSTAVKIYRSPLLTVDIIIELPGKGVVLIERKNPPYGWALPGGFVDYGESLEAAAYREALEETGLKIQNLQQFRAYSDPNRDPRHHTVSVVFSATSTEMPKAGDDAKNVHVFPPDKLPSLLAFDHATILAEYFQLRSEKRAC